MRPTCSKTPFNKSTSQSTTRLYHSLITHSLIGQTNEPADRPTRTQSTNGPTGQRIFNFSDTGPKPFPTPHARLKPLHYRTTVSPLSHHNPFITALQPLHYRTICNPTDSTSKTSSKQHCTPKTTPFPHHNPSIAALQFLNYCTTISPPYRTTTSPLPRTKTVTFTTPEISPFPILHLPLG